MQPDRNAPGGQPATPTTSTETHLTSSSSSPQATFVRWILLGLMVGLSMVTYVDRVNISIAARYITSSYHLTDVQMGKVFSAFILAYGLFQLPGGWLGDRFGPRRILTAAILWWSAFTALTACAADYLPWIPAVYSLIVVRFFMGAGEAAAWPNFNRTIASWMNVKDRGFASSLPLAGGGLGGAFTPPFIGWIMLKYGWRESFYASALLGVVAAAFWYWIARDTPEKHPWVNAAELCAIHAPATSAPESIEANHSTRGETNANDPSKASVENTERNYLRTSTNLALHPENTAGATRTPWRAIFTNRNTWLLFCSAATCGYLVYIYMTWFYVYLTEARHLTLAKGTYFAAGPYIAMAVMTPLGGLLGDRLTRRFGKTTGRRIVSILGMFGAGAGLFSGIAISNIHIAIIGLSIGAGAIYFALSSHWATTIDISRKHAGTVSGVMNWGGNVGGISSPILTPILAHKLGWTPALGIGGAIIIIGGLLWFFIQPERGLTE
jgi:MFS transporter, ACS family, glucarate transporter